MNKRMTFGRRPVTLAATLALAAVLTACGLAGQSAGASTGASVLVPASIRSSGVLTIGTTDIYPPYGFKQGNTLVGYEIDIARAVAKQLDLKPEFTLTQFSDLVTGIDSGKFDVATDGISDTAARESQVTFVDYEQSAKTFLVSSSYTGTLTSQLSACGLKFVGVVGSTSITDAQTLNTECKKVGKSGISLTTLPSATEAYLALESGRAQVDTSDYASAAYVAEHSAGKMKLASFQFDKGPLGFILSKSDTAMQKAVRTALKELYANGTMTKIFAKWDVSEAAFPAVGINLATK